MTNDPPMEDVVKQLFIELELEGRIVKRIGRGEVVQIDKQAYDDIKERYLMQERGYGWGV